MIRRLFASSPLVQGLSQQRTAFPHRDAWHFPFNAIRWSCREVHSYAEAYAIGLAELGLVPGAKVATWLSCAELPEVLTLNLACAKAGLHVHSMGGSEDWENAMKDATALLISPWLSYKDEYRADFLLSELPELRTTNVGSVLQTKKFPALRWVIQSGFRSIRGSIKLKHVPVYNKLNYLRNPLADASVAESASLFTFNGHTTTHGDVLSFASDFAEKSGLRATDTVVNCLSHKLPLTTASALAGNMVGAKSVVIGKQDGANIANQQKAKVLIVSEDRTQFLKQPAQVDVLVVGASSHQAVEQTEKVLKDAGVQASKVLGYSVDQLKAI